MRRLFALTAAMAVACLLSLVLPPRFPLLLGVVALSIFVAARIFFRRRTSPRYLLWLSLGLALGFLWFVCYDALVYRPAQQLAEKTIRLEAVVTQYPNVTEYGLSVSVRGGEAGQSAHPMRLYLDKEFATLRPGDHIATVVRCSSTELLRGRENVSLRAKGIFLLAHSYGAVEVTSPDKIPLRYLPAHLGQWIREQLNALYHSEDAILLHALLTGKQDDLSDADRADLSRTGLTHVVSVSGMHISFLAGVLHLLLRRRGAKTALIQILLIFFFVLMTGSAPGALRAAFLCSASLVAPLFGRRSDALTSLFTALALLLLGNPYAIASAGLQFSFAATLGIYVIGQPFYRDIEARLPTRGKRFLVPLLSICAVTLGATVLTTPLTAFYFSQVSLIAPISNLLANPLVTLAFLGGLLSVCAVALVPPLGTLIATLTELPLRLFMLCAQGLSKVPFAALDTQSLYYTLFFVLLYAVGLAYLYWYLRGIRRPMIPLCACTLAFCVATLLTNLDTTREDFQLRVLDVGQGQSLALSSGAYRALIDCGGTRDAGSVAANHFLGLGQQRLDLLLLTHYHDDHANGLRELFSKLHIAHLVLPSTGEGESWRVEVEQMAAEQGTEIWYIESETTIPFGNANLRVFPPLSRTGDNEAGLSLLCESGDFRALITGDMSASMEEQLLQRFALPELSLLILGHHGSRYATSETLLQETKPQYAVASVGLGNSYGHPAPETLARLAAQGTIVYRTDALGSLTVRAPKLEETAHATESKTE